MVVRLSGSLLVSLQDAAALAVSTATTKTATL